MFLLLFLFDRKLFKEMPKLYERMICEMKLRVKETD